LLVISFARDAMVFVFGYHVEQKKQTKKKEVKKKEKVRVREESSHNTNIIYKDTRHALFSQVKKTRILTNKQTYKQTNKQTKHQKTRKSYKW